MQESASAGFQLSPQQKFAWRWQNKGPKAAAHLILLLEGRVDTERLKRALHQLINRNEILRTTFQRSSGLKFPFQVVQPDADFGWQQLSWNQISPLFPDIAINDAAKEDIIRALLLQQSTFSLELTPVIHACLITLPKPDQHMLVVSLPAISTDRATLNNLATELMDFYSDSKTMEADPLQYADFAEWQNDLLLENDEEAQQAKNFWAQHDVATTPKLVLPFEKKPQDSPAFQPKSVPVPVSKELFDRPSYDPEDFFLACWQVLLSRLTGLTAPVIAYVSDGRNHEELKLAVGLFAKVVPFQIEIEQDSSFRDLLAGVREERSRVIELQDYFSPESIGENLTVGFRVEEELVKQNTAELSWSVLDRQCFTHPFHVQLRCSVEQGSWKLGLDYDSGYFEAEKIERMATQLAMICAAAAADQTMLITTLPILDKDERQRVLGTFNRTSADYPRDKCIHQLFEEQAALTPERPALRFENQRFSYGELNACANQLAHYLRRRGVAANIPAGLYVERSAEMIIGLLAIIKAGGCYVPLAPDSPKTRLAHQLKETSAPVILTQSKLLQQLPEFGGEFVCFDRDRLRIGEEPTTNPERRALPEDTVYVIYTSGSTGIPKGVDVRHSSLVNYSHFITRLLKREEHQEGLHFATVSALSADLGNTCIFPSLISGGCLHVISYETAMAPDRFASYVSEHPIDVLKITPSHVGTLLNSTEGHRILPRKYLILGGESLGWHLVNQIQRSGKCALINHYGPTEATVGCCTYILAENDVSAWTPATIPIGRPIANDEIYIVDSHLQPVPIGVPGELCIGGVGLAKGYLNQPIQTAERFVKHPFSSDASARIYRTGDLARFLPDGNIEFLGRIDQQVKIRGFRVEPAEIENVLKQHPAVQRSAIIPYDDEAGEKRLAAYVVATGNPKVEQLREFLLQQLPQYMMPSAFVLLDALPITANGKIDVRALPSPEEQQGKQKRDYIAPRNPEEEKLVAIWSEVLKIEQISVHDNFFELGGHSLLATQIISRIRNQFRVQLPLHSFLETPTISNLAEKVSQCPAAESEEEEMARLLQELEGISDEEAERILAAEYQKGEDGTKRPS